MNLTVIVMFVGFGDVSLIGAAAAIDVDVIMMVKMMV